MTRIELQVGERPLRNGLTALAVQNRGVETFAAGVSLLVRRIDEAAGEHGLAYLTGSCLEEGTKKLGNVELAQAVEGIGGIIDGNASGGTIQCPVEESGKAIRLLRELVLEPAFPPREVRRVQQEVVAEIQSEQEDPRTVASRRFQAEVYGEHPLSRPHYGSREAILGYKPADLRRFHREWFVPACGYVAIAGPAEVEESLDLLARTFRSFHGPSPDRVDPPAPPMPARLRQLHLPMQREQVHVYVGHPGVRRTDPDYYALSVMDHILGTGPGFTSRISKKLRDEMGLCYSVYASITGSAGLQPGTFTAYIGTSPKNVKKAIDGFIGEIRRIRETMPSESELRDVQDYLTGSFVFGLERNNNLVSYAVRAKRFGLGFDHIHEYPTLIRAVTREDVRRVARDHLDPDRVVIVSAGAGAG